MAEPSRGVRVAARVTARGFDADVAFAAGRTTAVVGPNGAGKSTLIRLISGQVRPDAGRVEIDGLVASDAATHVRAHRRTIALLEQRPLLFPHLSVLDNVAFGVRARGAARASARARALAELDAVGAAGFAPRRPEALSGGEAQRVALARALATDPSVVLLDEPFSALDVGTGAAIRQVLARRLAESAATVVLVTHDPLDVWALADDVVALEAGRVAAAGDVDTLLGRPRTGFLAQLSGVNLLHGMAEGDGVRAGTEHVTGLWDTARPAHEGRRALATFAPASVALFRDEPHGSPRNTWPVTVTGLEPRGATVRVLLVLADGQPLAADLTAQGAAALGVEPGGGLVAQVKATQVSLYAR